MNTMSVAAASMALALGALPGATGNGKIKEEQRQVAEFSRIDVAGGVQVDITIGSERRVTISADENLLPLIQTTVDNGELELELKGNLRPTRPIKLTVVTPKLEGIDAEGGVRLNAQASASNTFAVEGEGGANIHVRGIDADTLLVKLSGGADVKLAGRARSARFELAGGVVLDAQALDVESAKLDVSGGVDAQVAISRELTGETSGGARVRVKGRPSINVASSGGSTVRAD